MMIIVEKSRLVESEKAGSSPEQLTPPYRRFYKEKIDASRVPRIFVAYNDYSGDTDDDDVDAADDDEHEEGEKDGVYMYPGDDNDLLSMFGKSLSYGSCAGDLGLPVLYHVEVNADSCTVEECLKLLKKIGCDQRFITCSVESERIFYADLSKAEAAKLKGMSEIGHVYAHGEYVDWDGDM